jgi:hypothetical protein
MMGCHGWCACFNFFFGRYLGNTYIVAITVFIYLSITLRQGVEALFTDNIRVGPLYS